MMKRKICVLALPIALAACSDRNGAEEAVLRALKDPESARFGEFYHNKTTGRACLTTNAKNSMGGYTGDRQVYLFKDKGGWEYVTEMEESHAVCRHDYADNMASEN